MSNQDNLDFAGQLSERLKPKYTLRNKNDLVAAFEETGIPKEEASVIAQALEKVVCAAIHRIGVENATSLRDKRKDGRGDRAHPRGKRRRVRGTSFERNHLVLEDLRTGIVQPRVDEPGLLPIIARQMIGALEELRALGCTAEFKG